MTEMNRKFYMKPETLCTAFDDELMQSTSVFQKDVDSQKITISHDTEADVFTSRKGSVWDEE